MLLEKEWDFAGRPRDGPCFCLFSFLDSRLFASSSDDRKVALWDVRHMKNHLRLLEGHANWVKSVEYSAKENLLVTADLEGSIHIWDINRSFKIDPSLMSRLIMK